MRGGKRAAETDGFDWSQIPFKEIGFMVAIVIAIIVVFVVTIVFTVNMIKSRKTEETNSPANQAEQQSQKDSMPKEYEGYSVLGQLVIEKIGFDKYIVDSKEDSAMAKAPAKLYGNNLNENGNFCIAGHNYKEVFSKLNELVVGDKFYIVDTEDNIQDYEIKEIKEVEPTDISILMPVDDKIQVTLITCIEGATKRLAIVAERVNIEG